MTFRDLEDEIILHRLFVEEGRTFVRDLDIRVQDEISCHYGMNQGWLTHEYHVDHDVLGLNGWRYTLTDKGRERFFNRTK